MEEKKRWGVSRPRLRYSQSLPAGGVGESGEGGYRYEPERVREKMFKGFTAKQREAIFKRDDYRCVMCGRGRAEGEELHADHVKPRAKGGASEIRNGQTLCAQHNFVKQQLNQTETGKKMFIRLYELAKEKNNESLKVFCAAVLKTYETHGVKGHIEWKK